MSSMLLRDPPIFFGGGAPKEWGAVFLGRSKRPSTLPLRGTPMRATKPKGDPRTKRHLEWNFLAAVKVVVRSGDKSHALERTAP